MQTPTIDPRVRYLRAQKGAAVRDGNHELAQRIEYDLALIRVERDLTAIAPALAPDDRQRLATLVLTGAVA